MRLKVFRDEDVRRCTGQCCKRFPLQFSPEEIEWRQDQLKDGPFVNDMVIYLGIGSIGDLSETHLYTCRHHLPNGDCGVYEYRPRMCTDYPSYGRGGRCHHADCTFDDLDGEAQRILGKVEEIAAPEQDLLGG